MFSSQVAIVTGGGSGIGLACATHFGKLGASVALFDVNQAALTSSRKSLQAQGIKCIDVKVDVTNSSSVESAMQQVYNTFHRIDILVQAAGITGITGINTEDVEETNFDLVYRINVKGIFLCCKHVLPYMKKQNYGRIVNIASVAGKEGNAGMLAYSVSKAAVIGLTKVIGKEYAETGITVNALAPAVVKTPMVAAMPDEQVKYMTDKIPMKRCGELNEIANMVGFIASKACGFTTAFCFDATGGRATY
jgi:2-dehydro-3-deoxy-L-rhamnonate dehydrogenase (NAD+)|tara:strand:+ start:25 stop:771 length:747 start_codon:yes stop_codon:yes gene_type:complete